jgi:uncharacterized protein YbjT (DUF2867 family)
MNNQQITSSAHLIVVLGCTGTVGSEVMRLLARQHCAVRGILRHANREQPVPEQDQFSYASTDHSSVEELARAFTGAQTMFLSMGTGPEQVQIETNAIEAARLAGVRRVVKISAPIITAPASVEAANWHRSIESALTSSGMEHCFLRPYAFMQNWLRNTESIRRFDRIIGSAGSAPRNYVDVRDVAEIAVCLLLSEQPLPQAITIAGPEVITNQEIAERISHVTGRTIRYENLSRNEHHHLLLTRARLPEWLARHIVELEELAIQNPERASSTVEELLGHSARTMNEFLQEQRMAFMPPVMPVGRELEVVR